MSTYTADEAMPMYGRLLGGFYYVATFSDEIEVLRLILLHRGEIGRLPFLCFYLLAFVSLFL